MNKHETADAIKVMQAYVDGEDLEYQDAGGEWSSAEYLSLLWNWKRFQYRIKPSPREFWIHGTMADRPIVEILSDEEQPNCHHIKVREVL